MSNYVTASFGWYVVVAAFVAGMIFLGCVAFVVPRLAYHDKKRRKKLPKGVNEEDINTALGVEYCISITVFVFLMLLTLCGFTYWLSFGQRSPVITVLLAGGGNYTGEFVQNNANQMNASWPIAVVLWVLGRLCFAGYILLDNDGYGYYMLKIFLRNVWTKAVAFTLLVLSILFTVGTVICFFFAFSWPGYGTLYGAEVVIPAVFEILWLIGIVVIFSRQTLYHCCFNGGVGLPEAKGEDKEPMVNDE